MRQPFPVSPEPRLDSLAIESALAPLLFEALYALVPIGVAPPAWVRWSLPTGESVVPLFSSELRARAAAGGTAQLVRVPGRALLASLEGTAGWLDPDSLGWC